MTTQYTICKRRQVPKFHKLIVGPQLFYLFSPFTLIWLYLTSKDRQIREMKKHPCREAEKDFLKKYFFLLVYANSISHLPR